jgi:hypothetical protein
MPDNEDPATRLVKTQLAARGRVARRLLTDLQLEVQTLTPEQAHALGAAAGCIDRLLAALNIPRENSNVLARAAYRDDAYPERQCDYCGRLYRGPAVYCSLDCALADA